jgi:hypothetical protein
MPTFSYSIKHYEIQCHKNFTSLNFLFVCTRISSGCVGFSILKRETHREWEVIIESRNSVQTDCQKINDNENRKQKAKLYQVFKMPTEFNHAYIYIYIFSPYLLHNGVDILQRRLKCTAQHFVLVFLRLVGSFCTRSLSKPYKDKNRVAIGLGIEWGASFEQ